MTARAVPEFTVPPEDVPTHGILGLVQRGLDAVNQVMAIASSSRRWTLFAPPFNERVITGTFQDEPMELVPLGN